MKKLFIALVCLSTGVMCAPQNAQEQTTPSKDEQAAPAKNPNAPKFKFMGGDSYDFGTVPEGPIAEHKFEFENVGKEPLMIQSANASCGCTTPEWPKEPILPHHKGVITVRYNTQGRVGPFNKQVYIQSNATAASEPRYELTIKGTVTAASNTPPKQ